VGQPVLDDGDLRDGTEHRVENIGTQKAPDIDQNQGDTASRFGMAGGPGEISVWKICLIGIHEKASDVYTN
jgi:hypothetical protein